MAELDKTNSDYAREDWYYRQRSPQWMDANLQLLTSLDFDYDPAVAEDYGRSSYFQFPMNWDYSSYAFSMAPTRAIIWAVRPIRSEISSVRATASIAL